MVVTVVVNQNGEFPGIVPNRNLLPLCYLVTIDKGLLFIAHYPQVKTRGEISAVSLSLTVSSLSTF